MTQTTTQRQTLTLTSEPAKTGPNLKERTEIELPKVGKEYIIFHRGGFRASSPPLFNRFILTHNYMSNDIDLRTPAQRANDERQDRICADFLAAYKQHPDKAPHRLIVAVAQAHGLTEVGVKGILMKRGIYKPNGRKPSIIVSGGSAI